MSGARSSPGYPRLSTADVVGLALVLPPGSVDPNHPVAHFQEWLGAALRTPGACGPQRAHRAADDETTVGRGGVHSP